MIQKQYSNVCYNAMFIFFNYFNLVDLILAIGEGAEVWQNLFFNWCSILPHNRS